MSDDDEIDLSSLFLKIFKHWLLIGAITFISVVVFGVYAFLLPNVYEAEAKVLFEPAGSVVVSDPAASINALSRMESEIQIARSEEIVLSALRDLGLVEDARMDRRERALDVIVDRILRRSLSETDAQESVERIRGFVEQAVSVQQVGRSTLLSFRSTTLYPDLSRDLSNAFAENYVRVQIESKVRSAIEALRVVEAAVVDAGSDLEASQQRLERYLLDNATDISFESGNVEIALIADDLQSNSESLAELVASRDRLNKTISDRNFEALGDEFAFDGASDLLAELQAQAFNDLERRRQALLERRQADPTEDISQQLAEIESELQGLAGDKLSQMVEQATLAQERQASLRGQLEVEIFAADLPADIASDLFRLQSNAASARDQYSSLVDRVDELSVQTRTQVADSRIVVRATLPNTPSGPNRRLITAIGGLLGLMIAIGVVLVLDRIFGGFETPDDLLLAFGISRYGVIAKTKIHPSVYQLVVGQPFGPLSESFRRINAELRAAVHANDSRMSMGAGEAFPTGSENQKLSPGQVYGVVSSVPNEGKSTSVIGLGVLNAMLGSRVCVVDMDFRKPSVHEILKIDPSPGFAEFLQESSAEIPVQTLNVGGDFEMDVIPGHPGFILDAEAPRVAQRLKSLITELRAEYDVILIDTAPLLAVVETKMIASFCDAVVFNVRQSFAPRRTVEAGYLTLKDAVSSERMIAAFTFSQVRASNYRYAYKYYGYR